jgi:hypothetical protein
MAEVLYAAGIEPKGSIPEMVQQFTDHLSGLDEPLLILDDADKLKDRVLHLVVMLANSLAGKGGIIIMGNDELRMRIIEGVRLKKIGFDEIYQSIGRRFITLTALAPKDVALVCRANGIHDEDVITDIHNECGNNLHNATYLIQNHIQHSIAA